MRIFPPVTLPDDESKYPSVRNEGYNDDIGNNGRALSLYYLLVLIDDMGIESARFAWGNYYAMSYAFRIGRERT